MPRPSKVYLIDGSAQFHRAYFAIRGLSTTRGLPTNATYGFTTMLRKLLADENPEYVAISFDVAGPTFRHEEYEEYKANRRKMDDDLAVQIPYVRRVCEAFRIPIIDLSGFEADDVIATLARQAVAQGFNVVVVTGDKDLLQLVDGDVTVLNPGREGMGSILYDRTVVEEKFGVPPERVVDVLALVGDAVDNVPGVPGIGDKGARDLVKEFGSLEAVLDNASNVKRKAYREGLEQHRESAILSKRLVTLRTDAPVTFDPVAVHRSQPDMDAAHALFTELEFLALAKEFAPQPTAPQAETRLITTTQAAAGLAEELGRAETLTVALLGDSWSSLKAKIRGVAFQVPGAAAAYIPCHDKALLGEGLEERDVIAAFRPIYENPAIAKHSFNAKADRLVLGKRGVSLQGIAVDIQIAAYLLSPGRRAQSLGDLAAEYLGERPTHIETLVLPEGADPSQSARAAGEAVAVIGRLADVLVPRIEADGLQDVYANTELPLSEILTRMEIAGVKVDASHLATMSRDMEQQLAVLTKEIYVLAKGEFNINSPIQLREILFDRLGLRSAKKTAKTRAASTAEDVLEELALTHDLPRKILDYRAIQKLKSTYVDSLPLLIDPRTGRIHASFNQTVAATGRLSMSDPNLQNVPIRTPEGRRIREAFVAEPGHVLLSADYSQIELRVLAHLSKDETLIDTFHRGEDVHDRTSREVFGPFSSMPPAEQRRISKMVNYALLYGKTAYTLAKDIGVPVKEAEKFIEAYFGRYPKVRGFIDDTLASARKTGLVRTLLGRLRRLPDINSKNFQVRMESERQAMNTPVQGSAADLIKKAMIDVDAELVRQKMASRLILQIHDELLLEVPEAESAAAMALVKEKMESALRLDVPLVVDARIGANWASVH
jgi:DNA polymerase I